jgi:hypothetical protein
VIGWLPTLAKLVLKTAVPPDSGAVPRAVEPSLKVTVPVGIPPVLVTCAVRVTGLPVEDVVGESTKLVAVVAGFTPCIKTEDVLEEKWASPL